MMLLCSWCRIEAWNEFHVRGSLNELLSVKQWNLWFHCFSFIWNLKRFYALSCGLLGNSSSQRFIIKLSYAPQGCFLSLAFLVSGYCGDTVDIASLVFTFQTQLKMTFFLMGFLDFDAILQSYFNFSQTIDVLQSVGFIGLGNMGFRMVNNLIKAGYKVAVHDM